MFVCVKKKKKVDRSGRITKRNRRFLRLIPTSTTDQLTLPGPEYAHPIPYRPDTASPVATFDNEKQACSTDETGLEPPTTSPSEHTPLLSTLDSPSPKLQDTPKVSVPNTPTLMRRSTRTRRPALELDPASGQWVTKGFVSSLDGATNLGGDAGLYVLVRCYRITLLRHYRCVFPRALQHMW